MLRNMSLFCMVVLSATGTSLPGQIIKASRLKPTFATLYSFDNINGSVPTALVQGADGNLYGTTGGGGANADGTIFKITTDGKLTTLHNFNGTDGGDPGALIQDTNGDFYGTTTIGGANNSSNCPSGCGTIFKITPDGKLTTLHSFDCTDGEMPTGLVLTASGALYGTTYGGGANLEGTVFKIKPDGRLTTLQNFDYADGEFPVGLVQATNGKFYGTTFDGGQSNSCQYGCGTVFEITSGGTLTTLHSFAGTDGGNPGAALIEATNGKLYGSTVSGGANEAGTIFKMTANGTLTTLHSFDATDGKYPEAALVQSIDGKFYGTTSQGGNGAACSAGCGTVFKMTSAGTATTLHSFDYTDGEFPRTALVQGSNGTFYGTTSGGGAGYGSLFTLSASPVR